MSSLSGTPLLQEPVYLLALAAVEHELVQARRLLPLHPRGAGGARVIHHHNLNPDLSLALSCSIEPGRLHRLRTDKDVRVIKSATVVPADKRRT